MTVEDDAIDFVPSDELFQRMNFNDGMTVTAAKQLEAAAPTNVRFLEPPPPDPGTRRLVARAVIMDDNAQLWLYDAVGEQGPMLPGGGVEPGESAQVAAVRECREETGFAVECVRYLIDCADEHAVRRYYLARRIGGEVATSDAESGQAVTMRLVSVGDALAVLVSPFDVAAVMQARLAGISWC